MSYFLFVDECGHDGFPPYEVLAGVAIEDRTLWNCILSIHALEEAHFGRRMTRDSLELKGKKLLKTKTFKLAGQMAAIDPGRRKELALSCLRKGDQKEEATRVELTALAQAKIAFCHDILTLCARFHVKAFASIVDRDAPRPEGKDVLWKNYSYLFERYFYFLEDHKSMGMVIFDELDKSQCNVLIDQMEKYFLHTSKGKMRASLVIPEPMFVHSDLTTIIQLADIVAYLISWGVRIPEKMARPARTELASLAELVMELRYCATRDGHSQWSFIPLFDLRPGSRPARV